MLAESRFPRRIAAFVGGQGVAGGYCCDSGGGGGGGGSYLALSSLADNMKTVASSGRFASNSRGIDHGHSPRPPKRHGALAAMLLATALPLGGARASAQYVDLTRRATTLEGVRWWLP
jgi:hypothetical protein